MSPYVRKEEERKPQIDVNVTKLGTVHLPLHMWNLNPDNEGNKLNQIT
jgi:hypothetical protein